MTSIFIPTPAASPAERPPYRWALATFALVFLIYSAVRVWQGKPHQIAPLEEPARWLDEKIQPMK